MAAPPFFNGDDPITRDRSYKIRRVAVRAMDMHATMSYFCQLEQVDCSKTCMVGTSNGGTSILSYAAQSLPKGLKPSLLLTTNVHLNITAAMPSAILPLPISLL